MSARYDLNDCVRKYKGIPDGVYLDQQNPNLVTAEELANNLGLDVVFGTEFVKKTFTPVEGEVDVEPEVDPVVANLAALEAAAVNLPESSRDAVLAAVATAHEAFLTDVKESKGTDELFSDSDDSGAGDSSDAEPVADEVVAETKTTKKR